MTAKFADVHASKVTAMSSVRLGGASTRLQSGNARDNHGLLLGGRAGGSSNNGKRKLTSWTNFTQWPLWRKLATLCIIVGFAWIVYGLTLSVFPLPIKHASAADF